MRLSSVSTGTAGRSFAGEIFAMPPLRWLGYSAIAVLIYLLGALGFLNPVNHLVEALSLKPRADLFAWQEGVSRFFDGIGKLPDLVEQNEKLQAEVVELKSQLAQAEPIFAENKQLQAESKIKFGRDYEYVGAQVIGYGYGEPDTILINKGSADGLKVGDTIVVENILVGKINQIGQYTSRVLLVSNPRLSLPVKTADQNVGLLTGNGGNAVKITQILQTQELAVNAKIFTTGLNAEFPPNLFIGEVVNVSDDPRASTKEAVVKAPLDFTNLKNVRVLKLPHN